MSLQAAKQTVIDFHQQLDAAGTNTISEVWQHHTGPNFRGYASYPWRDSSSASDFAENIWQPLRQSVSALQRREDLFFAGYNRNSNELWVASMGHFMGLFDATWLGIPPTGKMVMIRYAEFCRVEHNQIQNLGFFIDLIGVMQQAGVNPLPEETGQFFVYPGPKTHDGIVLQDADPAESEKTLALVDRMVDDLDQLNKSGNDHCPPELLAQTWHDDMVWYGPAGIGATCTIERYQQQHQHPFRQGLTGKEFVGHVCRIAEGDFAGFFGWPNLRNAPSGGFLGLPANGAQAVEMQVVDMYRREGDKLAENWVIIDFPYWLQQQGLDVLARMQSLQPANKHTP